MTESCDGPVCNSAPSTVLGTATYFRLKGLTHKHFLPVKGDSKVLDNKRICHINAETERSMYATYEFPAYKKSMVVGITVAEATNTLPPDAIRMLG